MRRHESNKGDEMNVKRIDSAQNCVSKYVFDFPHAVAEAVLYGYPTHEDRTVICCSTQSGCPVGCRFCGAGDSFVRSLTCDEICSQVDYLFKERGLDPQKIERTQIMFMSMGEPLLNFSELGKAIVRLNRNYPKAALLISTSAPRMDYAPVRTLSVQVDKIGLQFSVHESTDEARDLLIPFKAKLNLREIAEEGERWNAATGRQPFFNYCAHDGNTSDEDANRLLNLFDPRIWQATVSVICERGESVAAANARQRELATQFMDLLTQRGFSVRCFDPAGQDDIGGGCGQLWFVQKWMQDNPEHARPSIGRGLAAIHTPRQECAPVV
jgi:23S rRNA (adenine2503-C2)-methyltransferase